MFKWKLKWLNARLLILHYFQHACAFVFDQIWFDMWPTLLGSCLVFFVFFIFWVFDSFCLKNFEFLCFSRCLIYFFTLFFFFLLFSGQTKIFGLVYGRTKNFRLIRLGQKNSRSKGFNTLFGVPCFFKWSFGLRVCLTNTHQTYFG